MAGDVISRLTSIRGRPGRRLDKNISSYGQGILQKRDCNVWHAAPEFFPVSREARRFSGISSLATHGQTGYFGGDCFCSGFGCCFGQYSSSRRAAATFRASTCFFRIASSLSFSLSTTLTSLKFLFLSEALSRG